MDLSSGSIGTMIYGLSMGSLGMVSFYGYLTFMRAIWNKKALQSKTIVLMSLCVSDLCVIFGHMIGTVFATFCSEWPWGALGCQINAFFGMGLSFVSIGNIGILAYDTYLKETKSVLQGIDGDDSRSSFMVEDGVNYGFYLTAVWVLGLFTGFLPYIGLGSYGFENGLQVGCLIDLTNQDSGNFAFLSIMSLLWFILPMSAIITYYGKLKQDTGNGILLKLIPNQMLISWSPYAVTSITTILLGPTNVPTIAFGVVSNLFAKICLSTNPYIYIFNDVELRVACFKIWFGGRKSTATMTTIAEESNGDDIKEKSN